MNKKGFIFDLDGVIVDTAQYHFLAWKKIAKSLNITFTKTHNEDLKGISRIQSLKKILKLGDKVISEDEFKKLLIKKNDDYLQYVDKMSEDEILPNVKNIIHYLQSKKQLLALGSASKNARRILQSVQLNNAFIAIVDGNEVTKAKPNPEVFLKAANLLSIKPEHCIVFEDSKAGIRAANTANMISIGIGDKTILNQAHYVFKDFTQIDSKWLDQLIIKKPIKVYEQ